MSPDLSDGSSVPIIVPASPSASVSLPCTEQLPFPQAPSVSGSWPADDESPGKKYRNISPYLIVHGGAVIDYSSRLLTTSVGGRPGFISLASGFRDMASHGIGRLMAMDLVMEVLGF